MATPCYNVDRFNSRRSPVFARHAMVSGSHPLATLAGIRTMLGGGNAIDAAVAAVAARVKMHNTDPFDNRQFTFFGTTSRGTKVAFNKRVTEVDHIICTGSIVHHVGNAVAGSVE